MNQNELSLLQRIALAFAAFFQVLSDPGFAQRVAQLRTAPPGEPPAPPLPDLPRPEPIATPPAPEPAPVSERTALQLLSFLQREGRLVDFVEEDLGGFSDSQVGAAARIVHEGCKKVLAAHFELEPVYREAEGAPVTVEPGFDPRAIRLSGNVVGTPPFRGSLRHHGWKARRVKLPPAGDGLDPTIVAPAEVEL